MFYSFNKLGPWDLKARLAENHLVLKCLGINYTRQLIWVGGSRRQYLINDAFPNDQIPK